MVQNIENQCSNTKLLINTIKVLCLLGLILITFNSCEPMYGGTKHQNDCTQLEKEQFQ